MADYKHSISKILPIEGYILNRTVGYVNDKDDLGKETIGGISRAFWPKWGGWTIVDQAKKQPNFPKNLVGNLILYDLVIEFYRVNFWNKVGGDQIASQTIADNLVDSAVNEGIKPAVKRAEGIVLMAQTGVVTPELVTKLNSLV